MENEGNAMEIDVGESAQAQKLRKCMEQKIAELNAFKINFTRPEDQLMATAAQGAPARLEKQRLDRARFSGMSKKRSETDKERVKKKVKRTLGKRVSQRNQKLADKRLKPSTGTFGFSGGKRKTRKRKTRKRNKRVKRRKKTRKRRR